jgi:hypothetical protein
MSVRMQKTPSVNCVSVIQAVPVTGVWNAVGEVQDNSCCQDAELQEGNCCTFITSPTH